MSLLLKYYSISSTRLRSLFSVLLPTRCYLIHHLLPCGPWSFCGLLLQWPWIVSALGFEYVVFVRWICSQCIWKVTYNIFSSQIHSFSLPHKSNLLFLTSITNSTKPLLIVNLQIHNHNVPHIFFRIFGYCRQFVPIQNVRIELFIHFT